MYVFMDSEAIYSLSPNTRPILVTNANVLHLQNPVNHFSPQSCLLLFMVTDKQMPLSMCSKYKMTLELPIHNYFSRILFFNNEIRACVINPSDLIQMDSQGNEHTLSEVLLPLTEASLHQDTLSIDVTTLFQFCRTNQIHTFYIMLRITCPGLWIEFCNHSSLRSPRLKLEYEELPAPTPIPVPSTTYTLQFSTRNMRQAIIPHDAPIPFEEIDLGNTTEVSFNQETGILCFYKVGSYHYQWILNLQGTTSVSCIKISILNIKTRDELTFNAPCVLPGQIMGQHTIRVTNPPESYSLINTSEGIIQYSNIPFQASLTITKTN